MATKNPGHLFVVAAPSGAGKTSLVKALIEQVPRAAVAVSHTTRSPRPGEVEGVNYYFVDRPAFEQMQREGAFLESANVFGNLYGTSLAEVERVRHRGDHVILEIDWQGARQIRALVPESRSIFILPPSLQTLKLRLLTRGQDDDRTIARRTREAIGEISHYPEFDYIIVNDNFNRALAELISIIEGKGEGHRLVRQKKRLAPLIADLLPRTMP
ncbi:MAG: guanylate kinase [Pseudomonadota bacterium]